MDSIAEWSQDEARAYQAFMVEATPLVRTMVSVLAGQQSPRQLPARIVDLGRFFRRGVLAQAGAVLSPYDTLLRRRLPSDLTRGPVAAFAAHAGIGPLQPGGAMFVLWQAAYHLHGQWHAHGGSQGLTDALVARLRSLGGELRCASPVERIEAPHGHVRSVVTAGGERLDAEVVMTAIDPKVALLDLLHPPLAGAEGAALTAARRGNVVQALVHVATDRLPPYADSRDGDWNGLQSYVDRLDDLSSAWVAAEAGLLPDPLPLYAFTTSALDDTLAPPGHHAVYLACPAAPATVAGGWEARSAELVERALAAVEERAPGFGSSVVGVRAWTPAEMEAEGGWPGAHPMHLDIALDQLGLFRPTRALGSHRTPVGGLYVSGAGTSPTGGIAGMPGKRAAEAVLRDAR